MLPTVARTIAVPAASAVTTPRFEIDAATLPLSILHATACPGTNAPVESKGDAEATTVSPTKALARLSVTETERTTGGALGCACTVSETEPVTESTVARAMTVPGATPVTSPVEETVALARERLSSDQ